MKRQIRKFMYHYHRYHHDSELLEMYYSIFENESILSLTNGKAFMLYTQDKASLYFYRFYTIETYKKMNLLKLFLCK